MGAGHGFEGRKRAVVALLERIAGEARRRADLVASADRDGLAAAAAGAASEIGRMAFELRRHADRILAEEGGGGCFPW